MPPPLMHNAKAALYDIKNLLCPCEKYGHGYQHFKGGDWLQECMDQMRQLLYRYTTGQQGWMAALETVVGPYLKNLDGTGKYASKQLQRWTRDFLENRHALPYLSMGTWNKLLLTKYPELKTKLNLHLFGLKKSFLPTIESLDSRLRLWSKEGTEITVPDWLELHPRLCRVVLWYHNESTFYAHNQHTVYWVLQGATPIPHPKGEGALLMVADFVSADYGWLCSSNRSKSANMSIGPTKDGSDYWFGVEVNVVDEDTGRPVHGRDGKVLKKKIPMSGAKFLGSTPQYFPPGHPYAGFFKGMQLILIERSVKALDSVDIITICCFFTHVCHFMDGYCCGLIGKAAAYAEKKYWGYQVFPDAILQELEKDDKLEVTSNPFITSLHVL
ncbi:hypothetical protein PHLGIDRAFT_17205 [Phlebiopsis gigantea 11061_1 CR5-6]|uniref:Uncharacterized protein n=1 Tax=Phlebiopsis gigantea (strain 11061_1 CR5-6) TaxID=745531 RepID=A0A0C3S1N9_PHLG1|nr:hypothetical protein PHLGIDRAFT_17205 [Phlebiopsis gigantea 11061_1 CR5-6]